MTPREIKKARELRADVGRAQRHQIDLALADRLEGDIQESSHQKRGVAEEFRATWGNWRVDEIPADTLPHAITDDCAIARTYQAAALVALLSEMGLAAWMFWKRDMNPWAGAAFALAITVIFERAIHFAVYGPTGQSRPKRALRTLKRFAFYPALVCFSLAVLATLLGRTVEGPLAADARLLALITSGLFFLTIGLVFLAAVLSTAAFMYRWSLRVSRRYYSLDRNERASRAFLAEVHRDTPAEHLAGGEQELQSAGEHGAPRGVTSISRVPTSGIAGAMLLSLVAIGASACVESRLVASAGVVATPAEARPTCHVALDTSGSIENLMLVWRHVRRELPEFVVQERCAVLRVSTFDVDGWSWTPVMELLLPSPPQVDRVAAPAELADAKNIRDAIDAKQQALDDAAERTRRELAFAALRKLDDVDSRLLAVTSTPGSDPIGALRRITASQGDAQEIFVLLTDMADTRFGSQFPPIPAPTKRVRVLLLLAPANGADASRVGAPVAPADQYANRAQLVAIAAPWIVVAPYFSMGYAQLIGGR